MTKPLLICVVGATAIGKTRLAIQLVQAFSTEIISADSRQFFKEMTIGTAVPSSEELAAAPHHFIQNKTIFEPYTVGYFEKEALAKLTDLFRRHQTAILVGGSGLYVDAVVRGLDHFPDVPENMREELNTTLTVRGLEVLQQELKEVDPVYYERVDIHNPHRVIRALEIYRSTKKPFSSFLNQGASKRNFDVMYVGLTAKREVIYDRINQRVDLMMAAGLLEEAKSLHKDSSLNALQTVGYRELFQYLDGLISLEGAISEIKKNTRRFAKRQGTWFRKNDAIIWFDFNTPSEEIITTIKQKAP